MDSSVHVVFNDVKPSFSFDAWNLHTVLLQISSIQLASLKL